MANAMGRSTISMKSRRRPDNGDTARSGESRAVRTIGSPQPSSGAVSKRTRSYPIARASSSTARPSCLPIPAPPVSGANEHPFPTRQSLRPSGAMPRSPTAAPSPRHCQQPGGPKGRTVFAGQSVNFLAEILEPQLRRKRRAIFLEQPPSFVNVPRGLSVNDRHFRGSASSGFRREDQTAST